jgi:hypothetical protein
MASNPAPAGPAEGVIGLIPPVVVAYPKTSLLPIHKEKNVGA